MKLKNDHGNHQPPSFLLSEKAKPPEILINFVKILLAGKKKVSEQKAKIASTSTQDICYSVSNGQWKMAKHLTLGTAVRHLTESAELVSMLNHFGHCISHASILGMETAVYHNNMQSTSLLPVSVSADSYVVTRFCWDNFGLQEETVSGSGTTHWTHGIVIQEVSATSAGVVLEQTAGNQSQPRSKRSVDYQPQELPPCFAKPKTEPVPTVIDTIMSTPAILLEASLSDFLWILAGVRLLMTKLFQAGQARCQ